MEFRPWKWRRKIREVGATEPPDLTQRMMESRRAVVESRSRLASAKTNDKVVREISAQIKGRDIDEFASLITQAFKGGGV